VVEATGETEGRAEQVRLIVPSSRPYIRVGTRDDEESDAKDYVVENEEAIF
jgi:hypothetical protein